MELVGVGVQLLIGKAFDNLAMLHDIITVRNSRGEPKVLFNQQYRETLRFQCANSLTDLLNNDRGEPLSGLVEQEQACAGAQYSGNRKHLLFAAGELGALARAEAFLEVGEQLENVAKTKAAGFHFRRQKK